jgi:undecaprenyl phosphate N,N'-diacetylbacillosamine 1-phosphate transferase
VLNFYINPGKRILDMIISFFGILITIPVTLPVLIILYFANQGKIFFIQRRPGKNEKMFKLVKFKTMSERSDASGKLLSDKERITTVGRFLRSLSLDELPQLINVLKGDMSLIGPRPLLLEYLSYYNKLQARRHEVLPGITGWAQVNGRNSVSWEAKFEMDVWYVDHVSFALDMKILLLTLKKVINREGISSDSAATMERFTGSNKL